MTSQKFRRGQKFRWTPESKNFEKPDPDPKSLFNFCTNKSLHQGQIKGGKRGQLLRALRSKGAPMMTFICFK